MFYFVKPGLNQ